MIDDERLRRLVRVALPPIDDAGPSRDLWPLMLQRLDAGPRWSWFDIALGAAVTTLLLMFPDWVTALAYNL